MAVAPNWGGGGVTDPPLNHHSYTSEDIEPGSVAIQSRNININDESAADIRQKADTAFPSHRQRSAYNPIYILVNILSAASDTLFLRTPTL